jgi:hypothetical protein
MRAFDLLKIHEITFSICRGRFTLLEAGSNIIFTKLPMINIFMGSSIAAPT